MKPFFATFHALVLALLFTGCARLFGPAAEVRVAVPAEPKSLDWTATDPASQMVLHQIQRGLAKPEAGRPAPDLAEGWSLDASGTRYTFILAKERWSDGVDLKPADFIFAWKRLLAPGTTTPWTPTLLKIAGARDYHSGKSTDFSKVGIHARPYHILEVILEKKDEDFPSQLAHPSLGPQREDVAQLHPADFATPLHLRTIGAYQPLEWIPGQSLLLVANSYASVKPAIAKVRLQFADATQSAKLLADGKVDAVVTPGEPPKLTPKVAAIPVDANGLPVFAQSQWK